MFEIVEPLPRRRCLLRVLDLDRCLALTRRQRLTRALLWVALGAAAAFATVVQVERVYPSPMEPLEPQVAHQGMRFSGLRLRFEHGFAEVSCQVVIFWEERVWTVKC